MNPIGERIKKARQYKKMTQAQLGARCGMADSAIRRYESGRGNPTVDTITRIAKALDVLPGELLGSIPQPDREYEDMRDLLESVDLLIEEAGVCYGSDEYGDLFYIWHKDTECLEEDKVSFIYGDLLQIIDKVKKDAEMHRMSYIKKRLDIELFSYQYPQIVLKSTETTLEGKDTTPDETPTETPQNPPEDET